MKEKVAVRKYPFNKLIRSNLPERMRQEGVRVFANPLTSEQYAQKLNEKLLEEADEVTEAKTKEKLIEELGDLLEVIYTIAVEHGIELDQIEAERLKKREINGCFLPEHYIDYIEVDEDNKPVIEYHENKDRPYKFNNER